MNDILLTGAGFSRNWGGWLASEAFEYLIGQPEMNSRIRNMLWTKECNFETALQAIRENAATHQNAEAAEDLACFNKMLSSMFNTMNAGFLTADFDPNQQGRIGVSPFLAHFDAIFTLNQDTLIERQYAYQQPIQQYLLNWAGVDIPIPGLELPDLSTHHGYLALRRPLTSGFALRENFQPYIKLHGSSNWIAGDDHVLVMGADKANYIDRVPLLRWYHQLFRERIVRPHTRIMIIGYSFSDEHINEQLIVAARAGTKLFIIDPLGINVIAKRDEAAVKPGSPTLMECLRDSLAGGSRRPLRETLRSDSVECKKILGFLDIKMRQEQWEPQAPHL